MKTIIEKFKNIFNKQKIIDQAISNFKSNFYKNFYKEQEEKANRFQLSVAERYIGKPVICISNEIESPVIGFGKSVDFITQGKCPTLVVENYVTKEDVLVFGKIFLLNERLFDIVLSLNPFQLCELLYNNSTKPFNKEQSFILYSKDQLINILTRNGFFDRLQEFKDKENHE